MEAYKQRVVEAQERKREQTYRHCSLGLPSDVDSPLADLLIQSCQGNKVGGKLEGSCRAVFKDGNIYEGEFQDGIMHGMGKFSWTDGLVYEGEFSSSKITGRGTYIWQDGRYTGDVVNGLRHGQGTHLCMATGTRYTGPWEQGRREGKGRLIFPTEGESESYYDGQWKNNKQHGHGVRKYRSGNVYHGEWREGVKEGEGEMEWGRGRERYVGHWKNGNLDGLGTYTWQGASLNHAQFPVSNRYEGEWKNGQREGRGSFYYASGAVYSGAWEGGVKEGRGTFTFKNGETYLGLFRRDRMARQGESEEGEAMLRPMTPLGSLIGDVGPEEMEGGGSVTDKFNLHITPLLSSHDTQSQLHQVHAVVLQHVTQLKKIYHYYSCLGTDTHHHTHSLTRMQFWQLLKDCKIHHHGLSIWEADAIAAPPPPSPRACLLMREFLQALVVLAHHLNSHNMTGGLSKCLSHFLNTLILPHACSLTGSVFQSPSLSPCPSLSPSPSLSMAALYQDRCWQLYQAMALKTSKDELYVTMRTLLWRFKDSGLVPGLISADQLVGVLVRDQPLAVDQQDYNLNVKITGLDVLEVVVQCSKLTSRGHGEAQNTKVDQVLAALSGSYTG